jgi:hypothetical protein
MPHAAARSRKRIWSSGRRRIINRAPLRDRAPVGDSSFDEFLLACDSRVAKKDLAFVTARGYAKLLAQIWRDKDRTKTQEDRDVELCPRALEVLKRHLALRHIELM